MIRSPRDDHEGKFDAIRDVWITDTKYLAVAYSDIDVTLSVELLGDMNGDHYVNGLDVDPFVEAVLGGPYDMNADVNRDGLVNGLDVKDIKPTDQDMGITWIKSCGKGRIFYCGLGHNNPVFWNTPVLEYFLLGIQFAAGDYDVPIDDGK